VHAATATAVAATTATATASSERRWRQSSRRTKRGRDQATKELIIHRNFSMVELQRRKPSRQTIRRPN
jgi:hypothetical protein